MQFLLDNIGVAEEDFKHFGGGFRTHQEFMAFQQRQLEALPTKDLAALHDFVRAIRALRPRHVDFYDPAEHYVVRGVYFGESGRLMTYST